MLDTKVKVKSPLSKYEPVELTDESVYDLARHYYTMDEIAKRFKVNGATIINLHGDAFNKGRDEAIRKPRMLLNNILEGFAKLDPAEFARSDVPTNVLLKAIELHARKYEGLGSTQTIIQKTDADKPSVSDIKFVPLEKPE